MTEQLAGTVLVDTNVLVAAVDRGRRSHAAAIELLEAGERPLAVSHQVIREFLAVATRPARDNGLGLRGADATHNLECMTDGLAVLSESRQALTHLVELVRTDAVASKQVHDANLVATALAHGVGTIVTDNVRHFARFTDLIEIEPLA